MEKGRNTRAARTTCVRSGSIARLSRLSTSIYNVTWTDGRDRIIQVFNTGSRSRASSRWTTSLRSGRDPSAALSFPVPTRRWHLRRNAGGLGAPMARFVRASARPPLPPRGLRDLLLHLTANGTRRMQPRRRLLHTAPPPRPRILRPSATPRTSAPRTCSATATSPIPAAASPTSPRATRSGILHNLSHVCCKLFI
jgi:hypothetical protein